MPDILIGKKILIISPQAWGQMFLSKHHYALELAKMGNQVFFLNPPNQIKWQLKSKVDIIESDLNANLKIISHSLFFPYILRFYALPFFHLLMKFHIEVVIKKITEPINIIWSFDQGNNYPFKFFNNSALRIFHPVDEPRTNHAIRAAFGSDVIFSIAEEILRKYSFYKIPMYLINHGVSEEFIHIIESDYSPSTPLKVGISGNFMRIDLDRNTLLKIIQENPEVQFNCWGSYLTSQTNIGGSQDKETLKFCSDLKKLPNVRLYGPVTTDILAKSIQNQDAFLICYDINKDQSKGINYHKILEFLATGKVVISNKVSAYCNLKDLLEMADCDKNISLPTLFKKVLTNIEGYNSYTLRLKRSDFAKENTYAKQINEIDRILKSDNMLNVI